MHPPGGQTGIPHGPPRPPPHVAPHESSHRSHRCSVKGWWLFAAYPLHPRGTRGPWSTGPPRPPKTSDVAHTRRRAARFRECDPAGRLRASSPRGDVSRETSNEARVKSRPARGVSVRTSTRADSVAIAELTDGTLPVMASTSPTTTRTGAGHSPAGCVTEPAIRTRMPSAHERR